MDQFCVDKIIIKSEWWEIWLQVISTFAAVALAWLLTLRNEKHTENLRIAKAKTGLPFLREEFEFLVQMAEHRASSSSFTKELVTRFTALRDWYDSMRPLIFEVLPNEEFKRFSEMKRFAFTFADGLMMLVSHLNTSRGREFESGTQLLVKEARENLKKFDATYFPQKR